VERLSAHKRIIAIGAVVSLVRLIVLMSSLRPGVPKEVSILAGPQSSRSYQWAERYADYVQAHGIRAEIISTAGSGDILRRLSDGAKPAVGFLQSGAEREVGDGRPPAGLESLGSLYFEPTWVFVRDDAGIVELTDLPGKRAFTGRPGSDARATSRALLTVFGLSDEVASEPYEELTPIEAADALLAGELDVIFLAGESGAESIRRLLGADGVHPISVQHGDV